MPLTEPYPRLRSEQNRKILQVTAKYREYRPDPGLEGPVAQIFFHFHEPIQYRTGDSATEVIAVVLDSTSRRPTEQNEVRTSRYAAAVVTL